MVFGGSPFSTIRWRDEFQSLISTRLTSPAGDFVLNDTELSITAKTSARYPADFCGMNIQLNHDWIPGTSIHVHLHWWQITANTPNWMITYRWQKQLSNKTTAWSPSKWTSSQGVWVSNPYNQITELAVLVPPVGYNQVSDIVQIKFFRDVTNVSTLFTGSDPVLSNVEIINLDAHIQVDGCGSRTEYVR